MDINVYEILLKQKEIERIHTCWLHVGFRFLGDFADLSLKNFFLGKRFLRFQKYKFMCVCVYIYIYIYIYSDQANYYLDKHDLDSFFIDLSHCLFTWLRFSAQAF